MGNYNVYYVFSAIFGSLAIVFFYKTAQEHGNSGLLMVGLVQVPLALMQWITGVHIALSSKEYPVWARHGFRNYWIASLVYFICLYALARQFEFEETIIQFWLFAVPWGIAIYQFYLVYRLGELRKRERKSQKINHTL